MTARFGFVSTYPPTPCGLATFTHSLRAALATADDGDLPVVRLVEHPERRPAREVVAHVVDGDAGGRADAVSRLDDCDVVVVQHEFGVYGGPDGDEVLAVLDRIRAATIVVLHTVLTSPTAHQREVLQRVLDTADAIVVMTPTASHRLLATYRIAPDRVSVIPHGAPTAAVAVHPVFRSPGRFEVLTWGLLGPGKGIEWAVEAMALVGDVTPPVHYTVAGQTHPKVVAHEGERYRNGLLERVRRLGLADRVTFDDRYRDASSLGRLVAAADLVVLPYDSRDQVTSGVLIEAVAAGKPVVATGFPHAVELLATGAGIVVAHEDPEAIAAAVRTVATTRGAGASMARAATAVAPALAWGNVADRYRALARRLLSDRVAA